MICGSCKIDCLVDDFINNSNICYRCVYRKKLEKPPKKRISKPTLCRTCGKEVIHIENKKRRQRTIFCSQECAEKGHRETTKNYWTRKLRVMNPLGSGGKIKWNTNQR